MRVSVVLACIFLVATLMAQPPPPIVDVPRGFHCHDQVYAGYRKSGGSVGLPVPAKVLRFLKIPSALVPTVVIEWVLEDTLIVTLHCGAAEEECCCGPGAKALAQLSLFQVIRPELGVRPTTAPSITQEIGFFQEEREAKDRWDDACDWPGAVETSIYNYTGSLGIHAGLEWFLSVDRITVEVNAEGICRCNSTYCLNHSFYPEVRAPSRVEAVVGEGGTFSVSIEDPDHDAIKVAVSEGARVIMVDPDPEQPPGIRGAIRGAVVWVPDWMDHVWIQVYDACGHGRAFEIPVVRVHPPRISASVRGWEGRMCVLDAEVGDEDLHRDEIWERLEYRLEVVDNEGTFTDVFHRTTWLDDGSHCPNRICTFALIFLPPMGWDRESILRVEVCDLWDLCAAWEGVVRNAPPSVELDPDSVEVEVGEEVSVRVVARDTEGDIVHLRKSSGPGEFREVAGRGEAIARYRWNAAGSEAWQLVVFGARDPYGESRAPLLIHVLQPPRVYGGHVSLAPGEEKEIRIYVEDPDSPSLDFSFDSPAGFEVEVVGEEPVRDYEDFGQGDRIYALWVRMGEGVAPGSYEIPLVVTDPDGLSGEAVLVVEVPNRPPRVSPQAKVIELRGSGDGGRDPWDQIMVWEADPPCFVFEDPDGHPLSFSVPPVSEEGGSVSLTISHWKAPLVHARPGYTFRVMAEVLAGLNQDQLEAVPTGRDPCWAGGQSLRNPSPVPKGVPSLALLPHPSRA
jgi:hypothetical protein